jgi:hypothetical protein
LHCNNRVGLTHLHLLVPEFGSNFLVTPSSALFIAFFFCNHVLNSTANEHCFSFFFFPCTLSELFFHSQTHRLVLDLFFFLSSSTNSGPFSEWNSIHSSHSQECSGIIPVNLSCPSLRHVFFCNNALPSLPLSRWSQYFVFVSLSQRAGRCSCEGTRFAHLLQDHLSVLFEGEEYIQVWDPGSSSKGVRARREGGWR